jgi:hypothetical protein
VKIMGKERGFIRVDVDRGKRGSAIEALKELVEAKPNFTGVYIVPRGGGFPSEIMVEYEGPDGSSKQAYDTIGEELKRKELWHALTINRLLPA